MVNTAWKYRAIASILAAAGFLLLLVPFRVCTDRGYVCDYTGSRKGCREWWFGIRTGGWYEESALEAFVARNFPGELEHQWVSYMGSGRSIFGCVFVRSHGTPGPIIGLPAALLTEYCEHASRADVKHFYDTMRRGRREEAQDAVNRAVESALTLRQIGRP